MDVRQLRYFARIVACGSFSKAARELHVAQPALSQHVANLEKELGTQLLARSTRGVTPTDCGATLLRHTEIILRDIERAIRDVQSQSTNPSGKVTIGLPSSTSLVLTVPLLAEVERRYPSISLQIIENHSGFLVEWLRTGRVDLAVVFDAQGGTGLDIVPLLTEDLYLVSAPGTFDLRREDICSRELVGLPLILTSRAHGVQTLIERNTDKAGLELVVKSELDSLPAIKQLVASGFGYSILPWSAIRQECVSGALQGLKITKPCMSRSVQLAIGGDRPVLRAADAIMQLVRDLTILLVTRDDWRGRLDPALANEPELSPSP